VAGAKKIKQGFDARLTGVPTFRAWDGTTEPGMFWTLNPLNPNGAARIAFGQYKAWIVGTHLAGTKSAHEALVQVSPVSVHLDLNKDFKRTNDKIDSGLVRDQPALGLRSTEGRSRSDQRW
jgi:hypothetical protein